MKLLLLVLLTFILTGCLTTGGETEYSIKPMATNTGEYICCEAHVYNSKDYKQLAFKFTKNNDGSMTVTLEEIGVNASTPMATMAESNKELTDIAKGLVDALKNGG